MGFEIPTPLLPIIYDFHPWNWRGPHYLQFILHPQCRTNALISNESTNLGINSIPFSITTNLNLAFMMHFLQDNEFSIISTMRLDLLHKLLHTLKFLNHLHHIPTIHRHICYSRPRFMSYRTQKNILLNSFPPTYHTPMVPSPLFTFHQDSITMEKTAPPPPRCDFSSPDAKIQCNNSTLTAFGIPTP